MGKTKEKQLVCLEPDELMDMLLHATAASGLVTAAIQEYDKTGVLPAGALVYVQRSIDHLAFRLAVMTDQVVQEKLPF